MTGPRIIAIDVPELLRLLSGGAPKKLEFDAELQQSIEVAVKSSMAFLSATFQSPLMAEQELLEARMMHDQLCVSVAKYGYDLSLWSPKEVLMLASLFVQHVLLLQLMKKLVGQVAMERLQSSSPSEDLLRAMRDTLRV